MRRRRRVSNVGPIAANARSRTPADTVCTIAGRPEVMAIRSVPAIKVAPVHRGNTRAPDDRSTEPDAGAEHQDRMDGEPAAEALSEGLPVAGPRAMSAYTTVVGEVHEGVRVRDVRRPNRWTVPPRFPAWDAGPPTGPRLPFGWTPPGVPRCRLGCARCRRGFGQ
jgi:hypothetical protein